MLWLAMFIISMMSIIDIPTAPALKFPLGLQIVYVASVGALKATVLTFIVGGMLERGRWLRALALTLTVIYGLWAAVNCFCCIFYGFGVSRKLILIFAQTNLSEASQFAGSVAANLASLAAEPILYAAIFIAVALGVGLYYCPKAIYRWAIGMISFVGLSLLCWYCISFSYGRTAHSLAVRSAKYAREVWIWEQRFKDLQVHKRPLPYARSVKSEHLARTLVFVIGESASRGHHQLYGYPLPTNPLLSAMADSLYLYIDAVSSSQSTAGALERILSLKYDDETSEDGLDFPLVVDLFRAAGYKVFWLSNQERTGSVSNTSGVMSMNSDVIDYVGAENNDDALMQRFDEALFPALDKALADTASYKLIFLHLLGSHVKYSERYPRNFERIKAKNVQQTLRHPWLDDDKAEIVAAYDNSILYTDWILAETIGRVSRESGPAVMLYLSDHGENVYDEGNYQGRSAKFVAVPMLIYANGRYRQNQPEIILRIRESLSLPVSTANVEHQLMTLTGTDYKLYDPTRDALSPDFKTRRRYVDERPWKYENQ